MTTTVFVYSVGIIDNWFGWTTEPEWLSNLSAAEDIADDIARYHRIKRVAMEAARKLFWEGDLRSGEGGPYVAPLPIFNEPGLPNELFMIGWKQDNNGSTFVASLVELPWLGTDRVIVRLP